MPESNDHIQTEVRDRILRIVMNRPEKKNALTVDMYTRFTAALEEAERDAGVRAVFITGAGDSFTSGNDVLDFMNNPPSDESSPVARFLEAISRAPKPMVAAVNGAAVGVGTTMLLHCDLVYASSKARFRMPFVNLGLCPEAGSSYLLPRLMGYQRAAQYLLLGEEFTAETAQELHLVNRVYPVDDLVDEAWSKALQLAQLPPAALRLSKALMKQAHADLLADAMRREGEHFMQRLGSPEAAEAFTAFIERRPPDFSAFE